MLPLSDRGAHGTYETGGLVIMRISRRRLREAEWSMKGL